MAPLSKKTIQHFTHCHPLTGVSANAEFLCDGCKTFGFGTRYRCEPCNFDLHDHCATCPMELSSFMHEHVLKLVVRKPKSRCQNDRVCDLCGDPVEGLFYRCYLPEYVRHVMHKDHPLRLQRSVPGRCMVCEDTCMSWHYRCGLCCFDLHLECVLAPCADETTTTSTPWSSKRPTPPPSAPPFFDASYACGAYGGIPPPPYFACPYSSPYAHGCGIPSSSGQHSNYSSQVQGGGLKIRKKMYAIAGNLAVGVLSNFVFGTLFS
ncbi:hypothetical protein PTKIN_Ptkin06aG0017500 [Pterospermum kingtungense]